MKKSRSLQKNSSAQWILVCFLVLGIGYLLYLRSLKKRVPTLQAPVAVELEMLLQTVPHKFPEVEKGPRIPIEAPAVPKTLMDLIGSETNSLQAAAVKFRNGQSGYAIDFQSGGLRSFYSALSQRLSQDKSKTQLVFTVMTDHPVDSGNSMVIQGAANGFEIEVSGSGVGTLPSQIHFLAKSL